MVIFWEIEIQGVPYEGEENPSYNVREGWQLGSQAFQLGRVGSAALYRGLKEAGIKIGWLYLAVRRSPVTVINVWELKMWPGGEKKWLWRQS